jgi:uncharacterized protein
MFSNMFSNKIIRRGVFITACLILPNAIAAGIDCEKASSPAEIVICSNPELIALDKQLANSYAKLSHAQPASNSALQASQQKWLLTRDKCANEGCLRDGYGLRIGELNAALRTMRAYKPDNIDMLALNELRQALEQRLRFDKEFPLETTLKSFEIKIGVTEFANVSEGRNNAHFPSSRPNGVTADEWQALQNSGIDAGGEYGTASYTLLDMDNDGKRDLIINTYMGGTGLSHFVGVTLRKGDTFSGNYACVKAPKCEFKPDDDEFTLYSISDLGSNQSATWLKLQGRVYVAYINSNYGVDHVSLLRPLHNSESTPSLTLHYQYVLSIPKVQMIYAGGDRMHQTTLDDKAHAALNTALKLANPTVVQDHDGLASICPLPKNINEAERAGYFSFGPGHYSYEIVADFPVWLGKTCQIGRLINWFGAYHKAGALNAQLWTKLPTNRDDQEKQYEQYDVTGKRKAIKIESGIAKLDLGDN